MIKLLLRISSVLLLSLIIVARFGFTELLALEISSSELVVQANIERNKKGLSTLAYNKKLERAAFLKAENMFKEQYWAHYGPNNESPWQFILASGYQYKYAGENLAKGFSSTQAVHDAWMASPTHRANILDGNFKEIGIAVVKGKLLGADVFLVVQMFGSTTTQPAKTDTAVPSIKITKPEDGDILEDGITDIRGETKNLESPNISAYLNTSFLGSSKSENGTFELQAPVAEMQGDQTLLIRGTAEGDAKLVDSVVVTIVSRDENDNSLKGCIAAVKEVSNLVLTYTCQRQNTGFSATVGNTRYTQGSDLRKITVPLSSLPVGDEISIVIAVSYDDKSTLASKHSINLALDSNASAQLAATTGSSLPFGLSGRQGIYYLFGFAFLLLLAYTAELLLKRQLLIHRFELLSVALLLGILFISFNFGFIRV
jgi:hypothetical protein